MVVVVVLIVVIARLIAGDAKRVGSTGFMDSTKKERRLEQHFRILIIEQ